MREYEFTFVVQPEITDEGLQAICERFEGTLEKQGASKLFYEDWGRRRLAYEIQRFQKGHYLVLHYLDDGKAIPEMERLARLDDSILRFLTVLANGSLDDVEARKQEAAVFEDERIKKAAERAEREAEEAVARAAEAETRAAEAETRAAEAEVAAQAMAAAKTEAGDEAEASGEAEAADSEGAEDEAGEPATDRTVDAPEAAEAEAPDPDPEPVAGEAGETEEEKPA